MRPAISDFLLQIACALTCVFLIHQDADDTNARAREKMKKIALLVGQLLVFVFWFSPGLVSEAAAQEQPTVQSISGINGFRESMAAMEHSFKNAFNEYPGPKPEKLVEAWTVASEDAFAADRIAMSVETQMESQLTAAELRALYDYFSSPFGAKVSALEIANAGNADTQAKIAEGQRLFEDLAATDPKRVALYARMLDGMEAVDVAEAINLNVVYSMMAGVVGAAGTPVTNEQMLAIVKQATAGLRQTVEKTLQAQTAMIYRDLTNEELEQYVEFLETPAGSHYYEIAQRALDTVLSKEAREFGNRLFAAMGMRKA
jgi:hypothetical protein